MRTKKLTSRSCSKGGYREYSERRSRICEALALVYLPPNSDHTHCFHETTSRCFNIEMAPEWLTRLERPAPALERPMEFNNETCSWKTLHIYREFSLMDQHTPLAIEGILLEMLAEAAGEPGDSAGRQAPPWLIRAKEFLHDQLGSTPSLSLVAREAGVHPVHLARAFRSHFHSSVEEYLRKIRIQSACRHLATSDPSLGQLAMKIGFSDQSHFTRTFKRLTGMTPREFHRVLRTN